MQALEEKGELNMESLQSLAKEKKPVTLHMLIQKIAEESVHHIEEMNGEEAACATAFLMEEVVNATTTDLSGDIEHDDHEVETKVLPGGSVKTTKKRIKGTVKEAVRGLKSTISLTKLLSVDPQLREYMLYVILNVLNAMDARLKLPLQVRA